MDLRLTVTGMTCGGCESAVKRALSMIDGISDVTASSGGNQVSLRYDPAKISPATIAQRIELLGYEVASPGRV
jgi:copper chaperone CopZ